MAKFFNNPPATRLLGQKYHVTWEPMVYQFAGTEIADEFVSDFITMATKAPQDYTSLLGAFLAKLSPSQHVWVVPPFKLTDYSSQPDAVDFIIPRESIAQAALLHDDQRPKITTPRYPTSDGFFRDAIMVCANQNSDKQVGAIKAYLAYLGVRFGAKMKMKFAAPEYLAVEAQRLIERKYNKKAIYNASYQEFSIS